MGRPSTRQRKYQVLTVVLLWSLILSHSNRHGPKPFRRLSTLLSSRLTTWQTLVLTFLSVYVSRNFARIVGLESPEPLANLYTRDYFRATYITTALDAGFWTAMNLRPPVVKELASMLFTVYYMFCAEQADEKVRKVRGSLTLQHLRTSWNKPTTPILGFFTRLLRPKLMRGRPEKIFIRRPRQSPHDEPIEAWLYFDGARESLLRHDKVILDIPGGGFVAMDPRCHDDKLMSWAGRTGLPVVALNYKKAPEFPYPYALEECLDAYYSIIQTRGQCVGLSGMVVPKIIVSGDSAGGNLATAMTLQLLQSSPHLSITPGDARRHQQIPLPEALVLVYPALNCNIGNWMTDEQMALIKIPGRRRANKEIIKRKSDDYRKLTPDTPYGSEDEDEGLSIRKPRKTSMANLTMSPMSANSTDTIKPLTVTKDKTEEPEPTTREPLKLNTTPQEPLPPALKTRLAMSSMISYFNDRILSPEMLRAMIILYIGPHQKPDFETDYLLSPLKAPETLLARFPKTYMLTGERDPLVDDTVIFAGRIRQAKMQDFIDRQERGLEDANATFDESKHLEVKLIPGISHGFLQFVSIYNRGWDFIQQCDRWMSEVFAEADRRDHDTMRSEPPTPAATSAIAALAGEGDYFSVSGSTNKHRRQSSAHSDLDSERPLEMSMTSLTAGLTPSHYGSGHASSNTGFGEQRARRGRGRRKGGPKFFESGRRSPIATRKSLVGLASAEDLVGRRMHYMTGGLMGEEVVPDTP